MWRVIRHSPSAWPQCGGGAGADYCSLERRTFGFNLLTSPGQTVTVIYNTNLSSAFSTWPILLTTNSAGSVAHISDPHSVTNKTLFYRAHNGS